MTPVVVDPEGRAQVLDFLQQRADWVRRLHLAIASLGPKSYPVPSSGIVLLQIAGSYDVLAVQFLSGAAGRIERTKQRPGEVRAEAVQHRPVGNLRRGAQYRHGLRRAVELFAGVGGFRLGLRRAGWKTVSSNQWEPSTKSQPFPTATWAGSEVRTMSAATSQRCCAEQEHRPEERIVPVTDLVVGGFPCQDYSVARTLNQAHGIEGKKGVLWWQIYEFLKHFEPQRALFENVDRLLKSPAQQREETSQSCLLYLPRLDTRPIRRVVNAADYGYPQRRRRVFILAERVGRETAPPDQPSARIYSEGVLVLCRSTMPGGRELGSIALPSFGQVHPSQPIGGGLPC